MDSDSFKHQICVGSRLGHGRAGLCFTSSFFASLDAAGDGDGAGSGAQDGSKVEMETRTGLGMRLGVHEETSPLI